MTRQGEANTTLYTLVQAMCTLDWKRAQQMFDKVNSKTDPRFRENFGRLIMQYILMSRGAHITESFFASWYE